MTGDAGEREGDVADEVDVVVIGSGFSGIGMGAALKRENRRLPESICRASGVASALIW